MRTRTKLVGIVAAATAILALAGCVQPPPRVIPTSEPSSAPVFASDADALAAAKKAYIAYLAVSDQILIDGGSDSDRLLEVATAAELKKQVPGFDAEKSNHWRSTGGTQLDAIELQKFDPIAPQGKSVVTVYACIDVSKVDVLDSSGASVVSPTRPTLSTFQTTFDLAGRNSARLVVADEEPWTGAGVCE